MCLGDIDSCAQSDRDGSCLQVSTLGKGPEKKNKKHFVFTNLDLGKYIYKDLEFKRTHYDISGDGYYQVVHPSSFHWDCRSDLVGDTKNVTCYNDSKWAAPSIGLLKTLARG